MNRHVRIFFEKTGRIKYISHLDLQRTMQRALKRSGLPVWESEGFNPHIYLSFTLPLSLGIESVCESVDIKITREISFDEIREKLNTSLPEGLHVIKAAEPIYKPTEIQKVGYEILFEEENKFKKFLELNKIIIIKKTKRGMNEVDLKPLIELIFCESRKILLLLPAGSTFNINPNQVMEAYKSFINTDSIYVKIKRTTIYCADGKPFI